MEVLHLPVYYLLPSLVIFDPCITLISKEFVTFDIDFLPKIHRNQSKLKAL